MTGFLDGVAHDLPLLFTELGQTVRYTPSGGDARTIRVIEGRGSAPVDFPQLQADGVRRWARIVTADVPELAQGDELELSDGTYSVDGIEPDRAGTTLATLIDAS